MIKLLHRAPATYGKVRSQAPQFRHPRRKLLKSFWNPTDAVVQCRRPVQRDDYIIDGCGDRFGLCIKEQPGGEKRDPDPFIAKHPRQYGKTAVLLGFTACKHYPTNPQVAKRCDLTLKIRNRKLFRIADLPDVAHHAVTVALIVRRNHDDWDSVDTMEVEVGTVDPGTRGRDGYERGHPRT